MNKAAGQFSLGRNARPLFMRDDTSATTTYDEDACGQRISAHRRLRRRTGRFPHGDLSPLHCRFRREREQPRVLEKVAMADFKS